MNILTYTSIFPNHLHPNSAVFVKNRILAVKKVFNDVDVKVVAPVPFFPPLKICEKWYKFSQIKKYEVVDGLDTFHPRYLVTPKIGMSFYGLNMFLGSLKTMKEIWMRYLMRFFKMLRSYL